MFRMKSKKDLIFAYKENIKLQLGPPMTASLPRQPPEQVVQPSMQAPMAINLW